LVIPSISSPAQVIHFSIVDEYQRWFGVQHHLATNGINYISSTGFPLSEIAAIKSVKEAKSLRGHCLPSEVMERTQYQQEIFKT